MILDVPLPNKFNVEAGDDEAAEHPQDLPQAKRRIRRSKVTHHDYARYRDEVSSDELPRRPQVHLQVRNMLKGGLGAYTQGGNELLHQTQRDC